MIPVYQTMTLANDGTGNCFNACIASILEIPLREAAPHILPNMEGCWWTAWQGWMKERGLYLKIHYLHGLPDGSPKGFSIISGRSSRTYPEGHKLAGERVHHACVAFNGIMVHDPFPLKGDFDTISMYETIERIDATT